MSQIITAGASAPPSRTRGLIAWVAALLAVLLAVGGFASPAMAADGGAIIRVSGAAMHGATPVYTAGADYTVSIIAYRDLHAGKTLTVTVPAGVELDLTVIQASPLVASAAVVSGVLTITLADRTAFADIVSVQLDATFTADAGSLCISNCSDYAATAETRDLTWTIDDGTTTNTGGGSSIVTTPNPPGFFPGTPSNSSTGKGVSGSFPWNAFSVSDGVVQVADPAALEATEFTYTVTHTSAAGGEVSVQDTMADYLVFTGTPTATVKTWDASGLNVISSVPGATPTGAAGQSSFSFSTTLPPNSVYTLTYKARLDPGKLATLVAAAQAEVDKVVAAGGSYAAVNIGNTATVGGKPATGNVQIGIQVPQVATFDPNQAFAKSATITTPPAEAAGVRVSETGALTKAGAAASLRVTYTLTADLTLFSGEQDVIITDPAPSGVAWDAAAITLTAPSGVTLTKAADAAAVRATALTYAVDNGALVINLGRVAQKYVVSAVGDMTSVPTPGVRGEESVTTYTTPNTASFDYRDGEPTTRSAQTQIKDWGDTSTTVTNRSAFNKTAPSGVLKLSTTTTTPAVYTFLINDNVQAPFTAAPLDRVLIKDSADPIFFDLSEASLQTLRAGITGTASYWIPLVAEDFTVTADAAGHPEIALSPAGIAKLREKSALSGRLEIKAPLTIKAVAKNQDISIKNDATLYVDGLPTYSGWATRDASSWIKTATIDKDVYDPINKTFVKTLRAQLDADKKLIDDEFTYRIRVLPKEGFTGNILSEYDELPDNLEFVGFAWSADAPSGSLPKDTANMGQGIKATWDGANHRIEIVSRAGEFMGGYDAATLYVRVKVIDYDIDTPIVNTINGSRATIVPTNDYPLSVRKADLGDAKKVISDDTARFALFSSKDDEEPIDFGAREITVQGGVLVFTDGTALKVAEPGTYWVQETKAPLGYQLNTARYAVYAGDGETETTAVYNEQGEPPVEPEKPKTYAVGNVTWIDSDKDGLQGDREPVLPGVSVNLQKLVDDEWVDAASTTTDDFGRYLFDELEAGSYRVQFVLTEEQKEIYSFTTPLAGDVKADSDAGDNGYSATIELGDQTVLLSAAEYLALYPGLSDAEKAKLAVKATQGIDPTWDAGVIVTPVPEVPTVKNYAIGDVVWVDTHKDVDAAAHGNQGEKVFLAGVTVNLERQIDGVWMPAGTTTTDENGLYLFDELAAATYRVQFVLTDAQAAEYEFTTPLASDVDVALNSDAGTGGYSGQIVLNGENSAMVAASTYFGLPVKATEGIDPTWDAGVVRKPAVVPPVVVPPVVVPPVVVPPVVEPPVVVPPVVEPPVVEPPVVVPPVVVPPVVVPPVVEPPVPVETVNTPTVNQLPATGGTGSPLALALMAGIVLLLGASFTFSSRARRQGDRA